MAERGFKVGLFDKMNEPVFLRESDMAQRQLDQLRELEPLLSVEGQAIIRRDIKCLEYGILGEKNIAFELKNSHMPMYILQDIYLEDGELSAQIDFMVFTRKINFVIECKNLYGDIEITSTGDFIRTMTYGSKKVKEGIYSPITQNERHVALMKKLKRDGHNNILFKTMTDKFFGKFNKSIVVLANPKTVLNTEYANKEVKEKVIRADQLIAHIKALYDQSKEAESSDDDLLKWAQSYLRRHQEVEKDYTAKYEQYRVQKANQPIHIETEIVEEKNIEDTEIFQELKQYRLNKSRAEKIKPYFIYNNNELKDLITKMPKSLGELENVHGFGCVKIDKYGEEIMEILSRYY